MRPYRFRAALTKDIKMIEVKALKDIKWRRPGRQREIDSCKKGDVVNVPEKLAEAWFLSGKAEKIEDKKAPAKKESAKAPAKKED